MSFIRIDRLVKVLAEPRVEKAWDDVMCRAQDTRNRSCHIHKSYVRDQCEQEILDYLVNAGFAVVSNKHLGGTASYAYACVKSKTSIPITDVWVPREKADILAVHLTGDTFPRTVEARASLEFEADLEDRDSSLVAHPGWATDLLDMTDIEIADLVLHPGVWRNELPADESEPVMTGKGILVVRREPRKGEAYEDRKELFSVLIVAVRYIAKRATLADAEPSRIRILFSNVKGPIRAALKEEGMTKSLQSKHPTYRFVSKRLTCIGEWAAR